MTWRDLILDKPEFKEFKEFNTPNKEQIPQIPQILVGEVIKVDFKNRKILPNG